VPEPAAVALLRALLDATSSDQVTVPRSALVALVALGVAPAAQPNTQDLLTVPQAAARLQLSIPTVYKRAKDFPFTVHLSRKALRFNADGLARWLAERTGGQAP